ncbi:hypothetical protein [Acidisoma sp. 7E03]
MPSLPQLARTVVLALAVWGAGSAMASAQTPAPHNKEELALKPYRRLLEGMGYPTQSSPSGQHFYIVIHSTYDYTIDFSFSGDHTYMWVYTLVYSYADEELARLPMAKLLADNDEAPEFFSLHKDDDKTDLFLQIAMPIASVNAKSVRRVIDSIDRNLNDDQADWNPNLWKQAAPDGGSDVLPTPKAAPAPDDSHSKQVPI